jgi:phospholipid/cholesterol/gamma-HCH transport system permease protein
MSLRADITSIGSRVLDGVDAAVELWRVLVSTLNGATHRYWRGTRPAGELARQLYVVGNKSLVFVAVTLGFIGMVMVYQTCLLTTQVVDGRGQVGQQWSRLLVLDVGPSLTAMMLATRVGAGIAAEIGSMKVTEQIDALRMSGVNPIDYLIVPRFIACIIMCVVLSMFGMAVAWGTGGLTGYYSFQINPRIFFDLSMVQGSHVVIGFIKAVAFGAAIPVVSGFCGLRARGSSEGVGWATTAAVIGSSFAVLVLDFIISTVGLVAFGVGL